jgi:hypothetical protein
MNRALGFTHRQVERVSRLLPEIALALVDDPAVERDGTANHYGPDTVYVTRQHQSLGLYPFEARAISAFFPRPPARLLLPGAGAGRELFALRDAGYDVDAFDASPPFVEAACARGGPGAVRLCDVASWCAETLRNSEPPRYDGVVAGWNLWTHLVRRAERREALDAFRRVCPTGPVLLSFWRREHVFDPDEQKLCLEEPEARWMVPLRFVRERLHRASRAESGTNWRRGMFFHLVSEQELVAEAAETGYRVAYYERDGSRFPNAVLVPGE